ncbi:hypothetical protein ACWDKQ_35555 [Saccharopolyspora sp. NPDC000995]
MTRKRAIMQLMDAMFVAGAEVANVAEWCRVNGFESVDMLGPTGRGGPLTAADLQLMHQTIYRILRDTARRPGEVVSLRLGCVEVIDGQHNLIYDNHKAGRMRRRLPITTDTALAITSWQQHRTQLSTPDCHLPT